jgi:type IV secretory pathway VirB10-like protein
MDPTPPVASTPTAAAVPPTVTDRRTSPRGVLPRGVQTWLLAGIAGFMLLIMFVVGRPEAPARPAAAPAAVVPPSADRVRDYQDRLRALEAQSLAQLTEPQSAAGVDPRLYTEPPAAAPVDPLQAERRRREYESLFASNVVLSRRPEAERPDSGRSESLMSAGTNAAPATPTMDDIADAALRATTRAVGLNRGEPQGATPFTTQAPSPTTGPPNTGNGIQGRRTPDRTEPISAAGPLHRILEGTVVDAVLTNRLDGTTAAPVNCLVTNPLYSHTGRHVLIPAGARLLGETKPIQTFGETRLAVAFHRLLMPDGRTYRLDQFLGLNQIGDAGLRDRVNQHYLATFGAASAVGLISGLAQFLGSAGLGRGDGDRTVIIAGGVIDATSQATLQVMNRFLNRLPSVTIREGHRVKVYLTSDLELPAYVAPQSPGGF